MLTYDKDTKPDNTKLLENYASRIKAMREKENGSKKENNEED